MIAEKMKKRGLPIIITLVFLALIILVNIFASMLTDRFFLRIDLTETGIFTLSDRAAEFLAEVNEPIDIIVLAEESTWRASTGLSTIADILINYSASSGGYIRVQYVNPDLNVFDGPNYGNSLSTLVEAHSDLEGMARNDIIFLSERRATRVTLASLMTQHGLAADQEFISALIHVLNERIARVVFIENHNESTTEQMRAIFERGGYVSSSINLALEEIPDDTVLIISAAPTFDFLPEEIIKLEEFFAIGGNIMIIYDFNTPELPILDTFLSEWGVAVDHMLILDEEHSLMVGGGEIVIGAQVSEGPLPFTEYAAAFTREAVPMGVHRARPLRAVMGEGVLQSMFPLVRTISTSSFAKALDGTATTIEREPEDPSGPFTLAYNIRHLTRDADDNQVWANLIVVGAGMFDDPFLTAFSGTFFNATLLTGIANDLNPFGERIFIPATDVTPTNLVVSAAGARNVLIIMVIVVPLLITVAGIITWRRRRHK